MKTRSNDFNLIGLILTVLAIYAIGCWMGYRLGRETGRQVTEERQ